MQVSIVVLNWNGAGYFTDCLDSIKALKKNETALETIVVDNGSQDNSVELIKKNYPEFNLIETGANLGYAQGNNVGINKALSDGADFIWIVNPDIKLDPNALEALLASAKKNPLFGIFGSKIYFAPGYEFHADRYTKKDIGHVFWYAGGLMDWKNLIARHRGVDEVDIGQYDREIETDFVTGASMFIRRQVLQDAGTLEPKFFLYFEENDLCQRAKKVGWHLMYVPDSTAWHKNAQATGVGSGLQDYYIARNRLLFGLRHAPLHTKLALLKESYVVYTTGRPWQQQGIKDFYLANFGKGSYA